jgi:hypothetical protein
LSVSSGFIDLLGLLGLKLGYRGSNGYLTADQKAATLSWIKAQNYWHLPELQAYLEDQYAIASLVKTIAIRLKICNLNMEKCSAVWGGLGVSDYSLTLEWS